MPQPGIFLLHLRLRRDEPLLQRRDRPQIPADGQNAVRRIGNGSPNSGWEGLAPDLAGWLTCRQRGRALHCAASSISSTFVAALDGYDIDPGAADPVIAAIIAERSSFSRETSRMTPFLSRTRARSEDADTKCATVAASKSPNIFLGALNFFTRLFRHRGKAGVRPFVKPILSSCRLRSSLEDAFSQLYCLSRIGNRHIGDHVDSQRLRFPRRWGHRQ